MFQNAGGLTEADKKGGDFSPFKKGHYILTVKEAVMGETDEKEWVNRVPVPTGNKVPQLTLKFHVAMQDGTNPFNTEGVELINPSMTFWVNDGNLTWNKKKNEPKEGRAVIAALLGIEPDGDINVGLSMPETLVDKAFQCYMREETSSTGKRRNVIMDPEPAKKK